MVNTHIKYSSRQEPFMPSIHNFRATIITVLTLILFFSAADLLASDKDEKPKIVIYDVFTESYDPGKSRLLTDVFRTELFKTRRFDILEKGVVQEASAGENMINLVTANDAQLLAVGRAARADKLLICSVEKFDKTIAISIRIVDVGSSFVDFSDNVFLMDENLMFDAIKEITSKIEFFYAAGNTDEGVTPENELRSRWTMLKAEGEDLEYLVRSRIDPEEYLTVRQYDITFTAAQYVLVEKARISIDVIRSFLQAGISYSQTERALKLGITKLDRYREIFQKAGYTFEDYLEAYQHNIMTIEEFRDYKKGYTANYFNAGIGGVADSFPIANAVYKFGLGKISWERYWTSYQRGMLKFSTDAGLLLLNLFAPTPFFQGNLYIGAFPYYFKAGMGTFAEVIIGGHVGGFLQFGFEILESLDFSVIIVPFGTQPKVSYTDLKSRPGQAGYTEIVFPYSGVIISYKFPLNRLFNTPVRLR